MEMAEAVINAGQRTTQRSVKFLSSKPQNPGSKRQFRLNTLKIGKKAGYIERVFRRTGPVKINGAVATSGADRKPII